MGNSKQNQRDSSTALFQDLLDVALMFERLSPEVRKALVELMRQLADKG